jgi:TPR repeat protein
VLRDPDIAKQLKEAETQCRTIDVASRIRGFSAYKSLAEAGSQEAMGRLANCYWEGVGTPGSFDSAYRWFSRGAKLGDGHCIAGVGRCHYLGWGVKQDHAAAIDWFKMAQRAGNWDAVAMLGSASIAGKGVPQDMKKGFLLNQQSAERGSLDGMVGLGNCHLYGRGTEKSLDEATKWFERAAEGGSIIAMLALGGAYLNANEARIPEMDRLAVQWYKRSVSNGSAEGLSKVAFCYGAGLGVTRDHKESARLYKQAVVLGCWEALAGLATCYEFGLGVEQDPATANQLLLAYEQTPVLDAKEVREAFKKRHREIADAERQTRVGLSPEQQNTVALGFLAAILFADFGNSSSVSERDHFYEQWSAGKEQDEINRRRDADVLRQQQPVVIPGQ